MTDNNFELYISGGTHVELHPQQRIDEIKSAIGPRIDVVFSEAAISNQPSWEERLKNFVGLPLVITVFAVYFLALNLAGKIGRSDTTIVAELKQSADVVPTDRNYHRLLAQDRLWWSIGHYGIFIMLLIGSPSWIVTFNQMIGFMNPVLGTYSSSTVVLLIGLIIWFSAGGLLIGLFFVIATMNSRNTGIIEGIETYIENHPSASSGCLIVGAAHEEDIKEMADRSEAITVVE